MCVCVCVREREKERERMKEKGKTASRETTKLFFANRETNEAVENYHRLVLSDLKVR